ncbi:putative TRANSCRIPTIONAL REGULATORY domain protein [Mycobacterium xenopi 3993]|nr:putative TRANSCRIPTIONAL REGULATORY domain protein [Mycobacterium xenopi 3993]
MMNARGWKTNEPDIEFIVSEKPCPAGPHRKRVANSGFTDDEAAKIAGYADPSDNPFRPESSRLRVV